MKNLLVFFMTCVVISTFLNAQNFSNIMVNSITTGIQSNEGGNSIAVDGSNVYLMWADYNNTLFSFVSKSTDGGATFTSEVKVGGDDPQVFGAITTDNSGNLYAAWNGLVGEAPNGIYFAKSTNQGSTFSEPLTVSTNGVFPQIATSGSYVYIFYHMSKADNKAGLFLSRSVNDGQSFETPREITDNVISHVKLDKPNNIYVASGGDIYCLWNDNRRGGTGTDIYLAKSVNGGESFGANVMVNESTGSPDKIRTAPAFVISGPNAYVTWRQEDDEQGNNRMIMFAKSINSGQTFNPERTIIEGGWGSPVMTINAVGHVYLAYPQFTETKNGIFCSKSTDGGDTFSISVFINDTNADSKNLSITVDQNDIVYAAWTDNRTGEDDVYFAKGTVTVTGFENSSGTIPTEFELSQNYPNPFNPTTRIAFSIPEQCNVSLAVYDMLGREVATLVNEFRNPGYHEVTFDASNLASGMYLYRLQSGSFVSVKKLLLMK